MGQGLEGCWRGSIKQAAATQDTSEDAGTSTRYLCRACGSAWWVHTWYKAPQVVPVVGARENVQHAPNDGASTGRATAWEGVGRVELTPQADVRVEEPGVVKGTALVLAAKDETEGSARDGWMKAGREGDCVLAGSGQTPTPSSQPLHVVAHCGTNLTPAAAREGTCWRGGGVAVGKDHLPRVVRSSLVR